MWLRCKRSCFLTLSGITTSTTNLNPVILLEIRQNTFIDLTTEHKKILKFIFDFANYQGVKPPKASQAGSKLSCFKLFHNDNKRKNKKSYYMI